MDIVNALNARKIKVIVGLVVTVFIMTMLSIVAPRLDISHQSPIKEGRLDISKMGIREGRLLKLNGEWEFYWGRLLSFSEIEGNVSILKMVPGVWNGYEVEGQKLPGFGYATYRLRIEGADLEESLSLRIQTASTAYRLYIDDELVAWNGIVSINPEEFEPEYRPIKVSFTPKSNSFDIIIHVANYSYDRGGKWYPIFLGTQASIDDFEHLILMKDYILLGAFFIMALYYICIYIIRGWKDSSSLYFVFLCLLSIVRILIYGSYSINTLLPWAGYEITVKIDDISMIWFPIIAVLLVDSTFVGATFNKINKLLVICGFILTSLIAILPIHIATKPTVILQTTTLLIGLYATLRLLKYFPKNKIDTSLLGFGGLVMLGSAFHDVLYHNNTVTTLKGELMPFGFLIIVFIQAVILARRLSVSYIEAKELSQKLTRVDRLKDEFLANTSHELRTPLNAIVNVAEALHMGSEGELDDRQKDVLSLVIASGKRLSYLVDSILDYSKLKYFDLKLDIDNVDIKRIIITVIRELVQTRGNIELIYELPEELPTIRGDSNRLMQILYNLVGNAIKYTQEGYVKVRATDEGKFIKIWVEDTGVGIGEEDIDKLFVPYHQAEGANMYKRLGTGLGLPITKYLVEMHGGEIDVSSRYGEGASFSFTIPRSLDPDLEVKANTSLDYDLAFKTNTVELRDLPYIVDGEGAHIVIVDDNYINLMALASILRMECYKVSAVSSSNELYKILAQCTDIDLLILDVMLRDELGYDICKKIRETYNEIELPILMLTARTTPEDIVRGIDSGANDYIGKPFDTKELLSRVRGLVNLKCLKDKLTTVELEFLQAQIKPHFIFNSLNTIISVSIDDVDGAIRLMSNFSKYLRKCFDLKNKNQLTRLNYEMELVTLYLEIEQVRFNERLRVNVNRSVTADIEVPFLVLQPIVENAIIHGILSKPKGGRVDIDIFEENSSVTFIVMDDGVGMAQERIDSILSQIKDRGVGLHNINKRLKKLYGKGLEIDSILGKGTTVKWSIPKKGKLRG